MNHFGRLAARVARPGARQPGPSLRSSSPIAEHDQRLTSFDVAASIGSGGIAGDDPGAALAEVDGIVLAGPASGPAARGGRPTAALPEQDSRAGAGVNARTTRPPVGPRAEPARRPSDTLTSEPVPVSPRAPRSAKESAAPSLRGAKTEGRLSGPVAAPGANQALTALASAFARVEAWMTAPVAQDSIRGEAASPSAPVAPKMVAATEAAAPPPRARPAPRAVAPTSHSLATSALDHRRESPDDDTSSGQLAAAPVDPGHLEIGQLSVQVIPPPVAPPVSQRGPAQPQRRPDTGSESSPGRLGTTARLGFGMRHW